MAKPRQLARFTFWQKPSHLAMQECVDHMQSQGHATHPAAAVILIGKKTCCGQKSDEQVVAVASNQAKLRMNLALCQSSAFARLAAPSLFELSLEMERLLDSTALKLWAFQEKLAFRSRGLGMLETLHQYAPELRTSCNPHDWVTCGAGSGKRRIGSTMKLGFLEKPQTQPQKERLFELKGTTQFFVY